MQISLSVLIFPGSIIFSTTEKILLTELRWKWLFIQKRGIDFFSSLHSSIFYWNTFADYFTRNKFKFFFSAVFILCNEFEQVCCRWNQNIRSKSVWFITWWHLSSWFTVSILELHLWFLLKCLFDPVNQEVSRLFIVFRFSVCVFFKKYKSNITYTRKWIEQTEVLKLGVNLEFLEALPNFEQK